MTEEKTEYIGRYGEVLKGINKLEKIPEGLNRYLKERTSLDRWLTSHDSEEWDRIRFVKKLKEEEGIEILSGIGVDKNGKECQIQFVVSSETKKKNGPYVIYNKKGKAVLECFYKDDLLEGYELENKYFETAFGKSVQPTVTYWHRGKKRLSEPKELFKRTKDLRKLFSDASVVEAIKTGDPVKVKSAMTRVITGTPKRRKSKGMGE